jgi:hypothetical protein
MTATAGWAVPAARRHEHSSHDDIESFVERRGRLQRFRAAGGQWTNISLTTAPRKNFVHPKSRNGHPTNAWRTRCPERMTNTGFS